MDTVITRKGPVNDNWGEVKQGGCLSTTFWWNLLPVNLCTYVQPDEMFHFINHLFVEVDVVFNSSVLTVITKLWGLHVQLISVSTTAKKSRRHIT